ncbi:hypothetical protein G3N95_30225 [Paraburkholderia sp. Tr-20389]|uniref:hypothetical protein n=1 Tax=Paraburkholderia sp. Tr-20389 TaxID=2703903 RepID=UPI00197FAFDF|nr:hypothetical protein [Paraburkholderia sp. Tr-20389]MBN3757253.1 hypothetical protein [Paraburkholderia sp. Tr-20389]
MDFGPILDAARRAQAAYIMDAAQSKAAFEALGHTFISQFKDHDSQAVLSVGPDGKTYFSLAGTRASDLQIGDIVDDIDLSPVSVAKGANVTRGPHDSAKELYAWALATCPAGTMLNICGHSLAASRTHLAPLFVPSAQIGTLHSFAAPKFADAGYYATYAHQLTNMVCVVNGADGWCSWPWFDRRWQARPLVQHIWLKDDHGTFAMIDGNKWPGGWRFSDHDMDNYEARIGKIACMSDIKPAA